jgi:hypothetical protein
MRPAPDMRTLLRWIAGGLAFVGVVVWLFGGPNRGWTKTSIAREISDPVTGLTQVVWEKTFLPGLDFLAAALGLAAVLFALSWVCRGKSLNGPRPNESNAA